MSWASSFNRLEKWRDTALAGMEEALKTRNGDPLNSHGGPGPQVCLAPAGKRRPKTAISDAALLELIRADLNTPPFQGEGHRKVWARLRVRDGVKVGRRRVLRLMRENNLLSPYRGRRGSPRLHEGEIEFVNKSLTPTNNNRFIRQ